ncbi:MAG: saccharopine dehydrogenase NADP-binding domain-containing protein, partial [Ardenticatenales bacterium]|nr:saccharopine dehydrogenase NADP-binding domain-containing protein [Ardenticatenales bacterium]
MSEIVVFGATGFTGTLVAERLHELGLPFAVAGRSRAKLQKLSEQLGNVPVRVADAARPRSLNALTEGVRVII